jgi:hypothetical protein
MTGMTEKELHELGAALGKVTKELVLRELAKLEARIAALESDLTIADGLDGFRSALNSELGGPDEKK